MTSQSRTGFADEKDSVLGELAVRMKKLSTDGYKQRRGEILETCFFLGFLFGIHLFSSVI